MFIFFLHRTHCWDVLLKHLTSTLNINLTLKPLSATRWESRLDAVWVIRFHFTEIYSVIFQMHQDNT